MNIFFSIFVFIYYFLKELVKKWLINSIDSKIKWGYLNV